MRSDGYAPLREYAAIGDGRTVALVARDGSIDWLCLPNVDSPPVFARILDAARGGSFRLAPNDAFAAERRYVADTNVLETTFRTASGTVRVTEAMPLAHGEMLSPLRELLRRVDGVEGRVELAWRFEPRFRYGTRAATFTRRGSYFVAACGKDALAFRSFGAGEGTVRDGAVVGDFAVAPGQSALLSVSVAHGDPLVLAGREDAENRLKTTREFWSRWSSAIEYEGPWRDAVLRSALVLKLLVFAPTGAIVAAPTTSLPEWIGGDRNWDYRYTWVRDAALTLVALLRLGLPEEARAFFWWLAHSTALTQPRLEVLYQVDGKRATQERELEELAGYRNSRPVRVGNGAAEQLQLDVYGYALDCFSAFASEVGEIAGAHGRAIAKIADWVGENWRQPDSGIWEPRTPPTHFTQSKAMCWVALDRACALAERGFIPDRSERWRAEADAIRRFLDEHAWDAERSTYRRANDLPETDGSLLLLPIYGYDDPLGARANGVIAAVRAQLEDGPLVDRYRGDDGLSGPQGIFWTCSFWLAAALAKAGRVSEATALMDELVPLANDVGLYAEEADHDGTFLGNFPQALVHLALIDAATTIAAAER